MSSLLRSRKFWLAVFAVFQTIVFHFWPAISEEVWQMIDMIVMFLIGMIAVEDAAKKLRGG